MKSKREPEQWEIEIKNLKHQLLKVAEVNMPSGYLMPVSVYDSMLKKILYLEDALERARCARDKYKAELREKSK